MKLKQYFKQPVFLIAFFAVVSCSVISCEKNDSDASFGFGNIFIPQATVSGGVNNNYLVPSGLDSATHNYNINVAAGKVNVFLGVSRAGKLPNNAYTVNVITRADTINSLITEGLLNVAPNATKTVVLLPASAYSLPATVSVPNGDYMASFNLAIDIAQLKTYAGKKVALCVNINSPTKYILGPGLDNVIVIIDVDSLNLP